MTDLKALTTRISELSTGYVNSQVLFVGNELGVFPELEAPQTADDLAAKLGVAPRGMHMLLDGLVALDLLEKKDGLYRNTEIASSCLVPGREGYQGDIVRHQHNGWDAWGALGDAVRAGSRVSEAGTERPPDELRNFILGMSNIARQSAKDMLPLLDLSNVHHMLDLGGGPATYAIVFMNAQPDLRATVFDLPPVIDIAREEVGKAGLDERVDYRSGDMLADDLGDGYDLILVSNIIHMFGPENNAKLVLRCFDALAPGGQLILKDFFVNEERTAPGFGLLFALRMLIATENGGTYTASEAESWSAAAGFEPPAIKTLTPQTSLFIVKKPS